MSDSCSPHRSTLLDELQINNSAALLWNKAWIYLWADSDTLDRQTTSPTSCLWNTTNRNNATNAQQSGSRLLSASVQIIM